MTEIKFELKGFKEFSRKLDKATRELNSLKEQEVSFNKLFSPAFMTKYTQFETINEMVEKSSFTVESEEDFKNIPDEEWDNYYYHQWTPQSEGYYNSVQ